MTLNNEPQIIETNTKENKQKIAIGLLYLLILLGIALRIGLNIASEGSDDMRTWQGFATYISHHGLIETYLQNPRFNHPPLMGWMSAIALQIAQGTGIRFSIWFKVPNILADIFAMLLIWKIWEPLGHIQKLGAVALYSLNPISILITAYHGNTDTLLAVLLLFATYLISQKRSFMGGLMLAAAINVKLPPILLIPAFALQFIKKRDQFVWFILGLSLGALPFLPIIILIGPTFYQQAIAYNSNLDMWGINSILIFLDKRSLLSVEGVMLFYRDYARYFIILIVVVLAFIAPLKNYWNTYQVNTATLAIFLILTPGFGLQYLVWIIPLFFATNLRYAVWYAFFGGFFAFLAYCGFLVNLNPLASAHVGLINEPASLFGLIAWVSLIFYIGKLIWLSQRG